MPANRRAWSLREVHDLCSRYRRLTREEEATCSDEDLVLHNLWVARDGISRVRSVASLRNVDHADLFQEGVLGLQDAARRFDRSRGLRFSTYAAHWVYSRQRQFIYDATLVHIPAYRQKVEVWAIEAKRAQAISQEPQGGCDDPNPLDFLRASAEDPEGMDDDEREILAEALERVSERRRGVLLRRFGLDGRDKETLRSVGDSMGVSVERARQLELMALKELGKHYRAVVRERRHRGLGRRLLEPVTSAV